MDSVTQVALGAAVGEAVGGKHIGNKALIWGGIAGFIPDLDIIPGQFMDPVTRVDFHRSLTHSLLFFLAMSPLLAGLARKIHGQISMSFKRWTGLFFLGLFTHALLDCFTTWGTQLFWPIKYKVAFQSVFVIDPLYTIPFVVCLPWLAFKRAGSKARNRLVTVALTLSSLYLVIGLVNKWTVAKAFQEALQSQEIAYQSINTRPTPFNSILWSANVETEKGFYVGYYSLLDKNTNIEFDYYPKNHELLSKNLEHPKIRQLIRISEHQYTVEKTKNGLIFNDLRFGQMAGWRKNIPEDQSGFTFSYHIKPQPNGPPGITRPPLGADFGTDLLWQFWERIMGNKP